MSIWDCRRCVGNAAALFAILVIAPAAVRAQSAPAAAADPRVRPGGSFTLEFPDLPKMRKGDPTKMTVNIPSKYDPHKLYPLIAWMQGGDGGYHPGSCSALADKDKFICIGLPYPLGCNNPAQSNMVGNFPEMWKYHKAMLEELHRVIPNISPGLRVICGFSNGGHTIGGYLAMKDPDLMEWFNVYIPGDGIERGGEYGHLAGRYICVAWGETSPNKGGAMAMAGKAESAKMKVKRIPQPNIGHQFGPEAMKTANEWLKDVVIADMISQALAAMEKDKNCGYIAGKAMEVLAEGTDNEAKFRETLARLEEAAKKEFEPIKAKAGGDLAGAARKTAIESLRGFLKKYRYSEPAAECQTMLDKIAREDLDKLVASLPADMKPAQRGPAATKLLQFAKEWEGSAVAVAAAARKTIDGYSDLTFQELKATLPEKPNASQRASSAAKCRKFITDWPATSGARSAQAAICEIGQAELDEIMAKLPASMTPAQKKAAADELKNMQKKWEGTPAADVFEKAIKDLQEAKKS